VQNEGEYERRDVEILKALSYMHGVAGAPTNQQVPPPLLRQF
jgi:hypothetical protein